MIDIVTPPKCDPRGSQLPVDDQPLPAYTLWGWIFRDLIEDLLPAISEDVGVVFRFDEERWPVMILG